MNDWISDGASCERIGERTFGLALELQPCNLTIRDGWITFSLAGRVTDLFARHTDYGCWRLCGLYGTPHDAIVRAVRSAMAGLDEVAA